MSFSTIDIVGQIADLKDADYKNALALATLIELLAAKGLFSKQEFAIKAHELDNASLAEFAIKQKNRIKPQKAQNTQRERRDNIAR